MNPQIKLIAMLRDPVERAFSAYNMYKNMSEKASIELKILYEPRSFNKVIDQDTSVLPGWHLLPLASHLNILPRGPRPPPV